MAGSTFSNLMKNENATDKQTITDAFYSNKEVDEKRDELIFDLIKRRFDNKSTRTNSLRHTILFNTYQF